MSMPKTRLSTLVQLIRADQLSAAAGSRDKTLKICPRQTGGFEHCQADIRQVGIDYTADWLVARLQK